MHQLNRSPLLSRPPPQKSPSPSFQQQPHSPVRAPSHHSLARSLNLASWCLLPLSSILLHHHLHSQPPLALTLALCITFLHHTHHHHFHPLAFTHEPSTPHSSFNNTKVSDIHHRERLPDPATSMARPHQNHNAKHYRNTNAIIHHSLHARDGLPTPISTRGAPKTSPRTRLLILHHQLSTTR